MEHMEPHQQPKQNFWTTYGPYIIAGIVIILAIVFLTTRPDENESKNDSEKQNSEQQSPNENSETSSDTEDAMEKDQNTESANQNQNDNTNNIALDGVLKPSDNLNRGNLMLQTPEQKVYIATVRDYTDLLNQNVTLNASGTIANFQVLDLSLTTEDQDSQKNDSSAAEVNQTKNLDRNFSISGTLQHSDNTDKGNYIIESNKGTIYFKTKYNYEAWLNSEVQLNATGNLYSFYNAILTK